MKVSRKQLSWFIILIILNMPPYLYENFSVCGKMMALAQYALVAYAGILLIRTKLKAFSPMYWLLMLAFVIEYIASIMNPLALPGAYLKSIIKNAGVLAFMDYQVRRNGCAFLKVYGMVLSILITINLATLILFPEGMYTSGAYTRCYFLGYDNTHISVQFPAMCALALTAAASGKDKNLLLFSVAVVILSTAITRSATSMVGVAVFVLGLMVLSFGKEQYRLRKLLFPRPMFSFAVFGAITVGLVSGTLLLRLSGIIQTVFHKDATLSARTLLWTNSLVHILQRPLWGYGYESSDVVNKQLVNIAGQVGWGWSSHNTYLWILFTGGIVLFSVMVFIFWIFDRRVGRFSDQSAQIIKLWVFVVLLMGLVESHVDWLLYTTLIVGYNLPRNYGVRKA